MPAFFPTFSEAERDRRWRKTRERMTEAGIDALALLPSGINRWDSGYANHRYLSQVGGNSVQLAMLFPLEGDPTVVIPNPGEAVHWRRISWVEDLRGSDDGRYGKVLAGRLKELKLDGGTIGIPYLTGAPRSAESPVPSGALDALRTELPYARLVDATALLDDQRSVKSDEEIAMIERASAIAERGLNALAYRVQVGMLQTEALAILEGAMLEAGCELGNQILWECSKAPGRTWWHAPHVPIERGDIIQCELEARLAGYNALEVHPISMGKPKPQVQEMFELSVKIFNDAMPLLTPGGKVSSVVEIVRQAGADTPYHTSLTSYETGLAQEGPSTLDALGQADSPTYHDRQVLIFKPVVRTGEGMGINFCSTVLVTPDGGRRLGRRSMVMMGSHRTFLAPYLTPEARELAAPWSPQRSRS